ncbi:sacsin N-terminal ATP-binding-like domain-containing protein [Nocardia sp. NPDC057668]|uniref:sacsin N-terminal ATP-binding-like domain-containing protein n=1 Tax=Nocardia sp. NPDC057668 TaxID=3346202 RepID=UPI00366D47CF
MVAAWQGSPTRLREDATTEADLVRSGYRDRLLTELAQNAADAAAKAGVPGRVAVWLEGRVLHVANTGVGLDISGVHALTALRASNKLGSEPTVGRFGVGFTAVLTVSEEIEFRSRGGSVRFSRAETWALLGAQGIAIPETEAEFVPPALRLAWALDERPAVGFDSEVVLRLRDDVDAAALLTTMRAEAVDLLLELPALASIRIGDHEISSTVTELDGGLQELRVSGADPQTDADERRWWQYRTKHARWLLPLRAGRPVPARPDVLRAPTRSDEELSLPALLIADIAMQPDRRRLLPGARPAELATGYADFARALPPADRLVLVPPPAFARSEADNLLREALIAELRDQDWLPVLTVAAPAVADPVFDVDAALAAAPEHPATPPGEWDRRVGDARPGDDDAVLDDDPVTADDEFGADSWSVVSGAVPSAPTSIVPTAAVERPRRASVFTGVTKELAAMLADIVGPLVIPELSGRAVADALSVLDVHRLGLARIAELSASLDREPTWWYSFYDALEPFVLDPLAVEELGALAVPLADGRLVTGPRTVVLDDQMESAAPVHWARLVHPEAAHELLGRLGARPATAEDLLNDPGLQAILEDDPSDPDTVDAVLSLAGHATATPGALPTWLSLIELPSGTGELLPADELLLPGAPLASLLDEDSPFGTVDPETVARHGEQALRAIGVGWGFTVIAEADPTGPDHHLDGAEEWWEGLAEDPPELRAVRDLDLVDEDSWPDALRLLLSDPDTRPLLADRAGYTAWWLRRYAHIDGVPLGFHRHPDDTDFDGLLPRLDGFGYQDLVVLRAILADPEVMTAHLAEELLDALSDPAKTPSPEAISQTHRRMSAALADGTLDVEDLDPPQRVRALSGAVIDGADALVLDRPWFGAVLPPERLVAGDIEHAESLAALLDLPLASQAVTAEVLGEGRHTDWAAEPLGVLLRLQFGVTAPTGALVIHDDLRVRLSGAYEATVAVTLWQDGEVTHAQAQPRLITGGA